MASACSRIGWWGWEDFRGALSCDDEASGWGETESEGEGVRGEETAAVGKEKEEGNVGWPSGGDGV